MDNFKENWGLLQFWYTDATADAIADALLDGLTNDSVVCVVSAPLAYAAFHRRASLPTEHLYLLEYDQRFELLAGDKFVAYDLNKPLELPSHLLGKADAVLVDPPYLEQECQANMAATVKALARPGCKVISSTGERMRAVVEREFGLRMTTYEVAHRGLKNEFRCYANFENKAWEFE